jgi:hypothetical protein
MDGQLEAIMDEEVCLRRGSEGKRILVFLARSSGLARDTSSRPHYTLYLYNSCTDSPQCNIQGDLISEC